MISRRIWGRINAFILTLLNLSVVFEAISHRIPKVNHNHSGNPRKQVNLSAQLKPLGKESFTESQQVRAIKVTHIIWNKASQLIKKSGTHTSNLFKIIAYFVILLL